MGQKAQHDFLRASALAVLCLGVCAKSAGAEQIWSLQDAWARAQSRSTTLAQAQSKASASELSLTLTRMNDDPKLSVEAAQSARWSKPETVTRTDTGWQRGQSYKGRLAYNLWDFGRQAASEQQAVANVASEQGEVRSRSAGLFWEVTRGYFDVVAAERVLEVSQEQLRLSETRLKQQERLFYSGMRPEQDATAARVDHARAKMLVLQAEQDLSLAAQAFAGLIEVDLGSAAGIKLARQKGVVDEGPAAWQTLADAMQPQEPAETEAIKQKISALQAESEGITARDWPLLSLAVDAGYVSAAADALPLIPVASANLLLTWEIPWNGRSREEEVRLASLRRTLALDLAKIKQQQSQASAIAMQRIAGAQRQHELLSAQSKLLGEQRQQIERRYLAGQASALELSLAEQAVLASALERARLTNQVTWHLLDLAKARGVADPQFLARF